MIAWLCDAFGFTRHAVYEDDQGSIVHAQLALGLGLIMLGSARRDGDDQFGRLQQLPDALGGTTQSAYLVVPDADAVYRRAKAAGAEIVIDIKDEVDAASPAAILSITCGTLAPTIRGARSRERVTWHPRLNRAGGAMRSTIQLTTGQF